MFYQEISDSLQLPNPHALSVKKCQVHPALICGLVWWVLLSLLDPLHGNGHQSDPSMGLTWPGNEGWVVSSGPLSWKMRDAKGNVPKTRHMVIKHLQKMAGGAGSGAVFHLIVTSDELVLWCSQPGIFLLLLSL